MNAKIKLLAGIALLAAAQTQAATMTNSGFETGDTTGWVNNASVALGSIQVVSSHIGYVDDGTGVGTPIGGTTNYSPMPGSGSYFLLLGGGKAGEYAPPDSGNYVGPSLDPLTWIWQTASQTFDINAGQYLNLWAAFDWGDYYDPMYGPTYDGAYAVVKDSVGDVIYELLSDSGFGKIDFYDGGWAAGTWTATASGTYTLEFGVRNTYDNGNPSYGLFDAWISNDNYIPEPATLALLGMGLIGLGLTRRRAV